MNKNRSLIIFIITLALVGCASQPSDVQIQTAIAKTESAASPTIAPTKTNTITPSPTEEPTATPTETPTPSPTPDIRIINGEPKDFQLKREDLPLEGKYYLPNSSWTSPHLNSEVVSGWKVEEGKAYLADTGRVTGWWTAYARGTKAVKMPEEVYCNVIQYKSAEGAQKIITQYTRRSRHPTEGWKAANIEIELGDVNDIEYKEKVTSGGDKQILYYVDFSYRNFAVECYGWGWEYDVEHQFMENTARVMLNKLKAADLTLPPTITPTITEVPSK